MKPFRLPNRAAGRSLARLPARLAALAACAALVAGCQQELYGGLAERDCNEMMAALLQNGVDAQKKTPDGGKTWTLAVDDKQIVKAMEVLRARGLPATRYDDLGALFKKDGLVSTPTEERVTPRPRHARATTDARDRDASARAGASASGGRARRSAARRLAARGCRARAAC